MYSAIDSTCQPGYDLSGNMVNDGNGRTSLFDSENRLLTGSKGSTDWEYDYDPFGRRVLKDIDEGETVTRYVYDGPHVIAEYNGQGTLLRKYVYGPGIDEPLVMKDVDGATVDDYYYHRDALGNVMALSDSGGNIEEGYTYSAFGIAIVNTSPGPDGDWLTPDGTTSDKSARGNPYMFTGRRYDWETGLYYYRARYYDATLGRFISADPISYAGGMNLYAYVNNNPLKYTDPYGRNPLVYLGIGLGIAAGLWGHENIDWGTDELTDQQEEYVCQLENLLRDCANEVGDDLLPEVLDELNVSGIFEKGKMPDDGISETRNGRCWGYGNRTILSADFFDRDLESQLTTLIHEAGHAYTEDWTEDIMYDYASETMKRLRDAIIRREKQMVRVSE